MTRLQFLLLATVFQGGLCLLGLGLAYWQSVELAWNWNLVSVARGVLLTIPSAIFLWWMVKSARPSLKELREFLVHRFGPLLRECTVFDLLYVSVLAGFSEEILFRGAIQNLLLGWGIVAAILGTNLLFGLCHAVTTVYFVYAFLAGCYLTWVAGVHTQYLSSAAITHSLYDLMALIIIRTQAFSQDGSTVDDESESAGELTGSTTGTPEEKEM